MVPTVMRRQVGQTADISETGMNLNYWRDLMNRVPTGVPTLHIKNSIQKLQKIKIFKDLGYLIIKVTLRCNKNRKLENVRGRLTISSPTNQSSFVN